MIGLPSVAFYGNYTVKWHFLHISHIFPRVLLTPLLVLYPVSLYVFFFQLKLSQVSLHVSQTGVELQFPSTLSRVMGCE